MKTTSWILFGVAWVGMHRMVAAETASATATCLSLNAPSYTRNVSGLGTVTSYFTTYDGTYGTPLHDQLSDGSWVFSSELRPRGGAAGVYECDYLNVSSIFGVFSQGSVIAVYPAIDSDNNSIPDFQQYDHEGSFSWSGGIFPDSGTPLTMTGTMNSSFLSSSYQIYQNGVVVDSVSGSAPFLHAVGTIGYSRLPQNTLSLNIALDTQPYSYTGSTSFTVQNEDKILVGDFTLRRNDGRNITVYSFTLTRRGTKYSGRFNMNDGNLSTSWRDYSEWVLELVDPNDYDGNGIPDLSDAVPAAPVIVHEPKSADALLKGTATFSCAATTREPNTYQWFFRNRPIADGNSSILIVTNLRFAAAGPYWVEVRNSIGTTRSQAASLRVLRPVRILSHPKSRNIATGKNLLLRTVASGGKPLFFQWAKDGENIPGATYRKLLIKGVTSTNTGTYTVSVSNTVSSAMSSPAAIVVN